MANATGQKLISADTTFTIAGFARAKESGDYGSCHANQAAFTFGQSGKKKAPRITRPKKSRCRLRQSRRKMISVRFGSCPCLSKEPLRSFKYQSHHRLNGERLRIADGNTG